MIPTMTPAVREATLVHLAELGKKLAEQREILRARLENASE